MTGILPDSPGFRLRKLRKKLKKTQQVFADELGVSGSTLSRYEKNMRGPDVYFYKLLRMKTGVDLTWLLTGEGSMFELQNKDFLRIKSVVIRIIKKAGEMVALIDEIERFNLK